MLTQAGIGRPTSCQVGGALGPVAHCLPKLMNFAVPRCVKPKGTQIVSTQLYHFSDACELAYGAASYLKPVCMDGFLMMAKSRLAPLKGSTIPRIELAGALKAFQVSETLQEELDIELQPAVFWTDSTIVLWYINHTEKRFSNLCGQSSGQGHKPH